MHRRCLWRSIALTLLSLNLLAISLSSVFCLLSSGLFVLQLMVCRRRRECDYQGSHHGDHRCCNRGQGCRYIPLRFRIEAFIRPLHRGLSSRCPHLHSAAPTLSQHRTLSPLLCSVASADWRCPLLLVLIAAFRRIQVDCRRTRANAWWWKQRRQPTRHPLWCVRHLPRDHI